MKDLYKIYDIKIEKYYKKHFLYLENLNLDFDYLEVLPSYKKESYLNYLSKIDKKIKKIDKNFNFVNVFNNYDILFNSLKSAKINKIAYKAMTSIETNKSILGNLKKFKPNKSFSKKINYCLSSNVTGRLNVKKGPNILILPSRCRNIFESRHESGKLLSIDFNNLEPRLFLKLCNNDVEDKDIYSYFANLTNENIDRSIIKKAVISRLYGSSMNYLEKNISKEKIDKIKSVVEEYFDICCIEKLANNGDENLRYNYFGRPIRNIDENKSNVVINNYIQSSAVDIALTYFYKLVINLNLEKAVPLFIIHDAFVFDVEQSYIKEFSEHIKKGCNIPKLGQFPISIDNFV